ncbi:PilZ domain-containing protein [Spartinivicinus poritis]|uniref:PilZ domain-containing protein n=1 Tax=Spartinivicinus poritis TaxID=2994640 RepID=A0ABT5UH07_9GAMM|nr:PilZ domain-containing protein [Spartinivicinus sp. A2-2]MDE1464339.1 PilZ domain-containing protein [Spartinivicinus sp. A2-2]
MTKLIDVPVSQEQRAYPRKEINWQTAIKGTDHGEALPAEAINISVQGVLLTTSVSFQIKQKLSIMIKAHHLNNQLIIYAIAEVKHVIKRKSDYHIGLQFKKIQPLAKKFIYRFVENSI